MLAFDALALIPLLPLLGAAILGLFGAKMDRSLVSTIALGTVLGSFLVTVVSVVTLMVREAPLEAVLWTWIPTERFGALELAFGIDQLSAVLMLVVTGVGFLIHVYSTGYMEDDPAYGRYFAYLNFFIAMMSVLVLGRSLPVLFIGWEGVGLASYLLIGFWYSDDAKASAGRKAFIVNRVGDFGFVLGTIALMGLFGTADFVELKRAVTALGGDPTMIGAEMIRTGIFSGMTVGSVVTFACIALFVGACGKSAQIPLFVWLPDAMAGPTPVSALIHAATMVTAGVYMVCRLGFLFDMAPAAASLVATIGALTALFAATIGLAQDDIKKVLAYSTVSQLGYMFLAAGVGAYSIAMFHVVTHAFFKACLFLGSGAVIHALHGEQDMRRMGGLKKELPAVYMTFGLSTLALAGILPLSGFFSKDAILAHALEHRPVLGVMGMAGAFLTALYMSRLFCLTFFGRLRHPDPHLAEHVHRPGRAMTIPLWILAGLAVVGGALNLPHFFHPPLSLDHFFAPVVRIAELEGSLSHELTLWAASTLIAVSGLGLGYWLYKDGPSALVESQTKGGPVAGIAKLLANKWYVDELYDVVVVRPAHFAGAIASSLIDPWVVDGVLVKLIPSVLVRGSGLLLARTQTGNVQVYASMFVIAAALVTGIWATW
ncbi:MAG: NADH-quinone oxidoreductase subunit L [Deltaproteobacteria bacterium]|nr:NADH-quinone oxidoreductase subunit L [Deltaproteobacteria bacterium]